MTKVSKDLVGYDEFRKFYETGDKSQLFAGHRAFMGLNHSGFISRLRSSTGAHYMGNEFPGVEYEMKFNVTVDQKPAVQMSPNALAETVRRTFNGSRKYLADGLVPLGYEDVNYVGGDKELFLFVEGPPKRIKMKKDLAFIVNMPETALITKRTEKSHDMRTYADLMSACVEAGKQGAQFQGRMQKGRTDVAVLDVRTGRVYDITASESTANDYRLYQVEVEYKGFIGAFPGERDVSGKYESEEQIVQGIVDIGLHMRNRIRFDKPWAFRLHPTLDTKYDFIRKAYEGRIDKIRAMHLHPLGISGIAAITKK